MTKGGNFFGHRVVSELRTSSTLHLHGQVVVPGGLSNHFLACNTPTGVFDECLREKKSKAPNDRAAQIGPLLQSGGGGGPAGAARARWGSMAACTSLLPATEAGPWASALRGYQIPALGPA